MGMAWILWEQWLSFNIANNDVLPELLIFKHCNRANGNVMNAMCIL